VNLPTPRPGIRIYDDPLWERFWCACESLHMSLNSHVGGAGGDIEFVGNHAQAMLYVDRSGWLSRRALLAYFSVVCSSVIPICVSS